MSQTMPLQRPLGRRGPWFAAIWLVFLIDPVRVAWDAHDTAKGDIGLLATLAFGTLYIVIWIRLRADRARLVTRPSWVESIGWLASMASLATVMVWALGETGTASAVYCAVATVMLLPFAYAAPIVVGIAALMIVLGETRPTWDSGAGTAFGVLAAALAVFGIQQMMVRNIELIKAHDENADLAVENERTRFARDLHDILGHSLTVITVKAELAQRLLDVDPPRARAELADLERLSRDALADVRRAVEGYRDLSLPGELARARTALAAAEITAELPNSTEDVPTALRELFAWTVREGVTNVLRHSNAQRCSVVLTPTSVEVRDDGGGPGGSTLGSGLTGLQERASVLGGTVVTRSLEPGYSLRVVVA
ncbi:sensor histidine kinase [Janibacter sp. HTCC2649]|uniref:sensor histidine kinase n=1 Tax=Janibacter sp. HTCC2649 TaxID=313589 RepID=UPI001ED97955|nr:histidine kinase [Janibacter sp. HTCC2649]